MIINATPHTITILSKRGVTQDPKTKAFVALATDVEVLKTLEPSGILPRVKMDSKPTEPIDGFPVEEVIYGDIEGLPEYREGTYYIVSGLVASAATRLGRKDVLAPGGLVRDAGNSSTMMGALFLQKP